MRRLNLDPWPLPGTPIHAILWVIAVVYLGQMLLDQRLAEYGRDPGNILNFDIMALWASGSHSPNAITESFDLWRLFNPAWLHAGALHVVMNALVLFQLGPLVLSLFGPARTLFAWLFCGFATSVLSLAYFQVVGYEGGRVAIGASGAVMGLAGLLLVTLRRRRDAIAAAITRSLFQWMLVVLLMGWIIEQIDQVGHIAGFISGALLGLVMHSDRFDEMRRGAWQSKVRAALLVLLLIGHAGSLIYGAITAEQRMAQLIGYGQVIIGSQIVVLGRAEGQSPRDQKESIDALEARILPPRDRELQRRLVDALLTESTPAHQIDALRTQLLRRYEAFEPDQIFLIPRGAPR